MEMIWVMRFNFLIRMLFFVIRMVRISLLWGLLAVFVFLVKMWGVIWLSDMACSIWGVFKMLLIVEDSVVF